MQGISKADQERREAEAAAIRQMAPEAATMADLARRAGIRRGRLYVVIKWMGDEGRQIQLGTKLGKHVED